MTGYRDDSPAQFALRFCLSFKAVSTAIPGMLNRAHVEENVRAGEQGGLEAVDVERIREVYERWNFFAEDSASGVQKEIT